MYIGFSSFSVYRFFVTFSNRAPDPERDRYRKRVQLFKASLENMEGTFKTHAPWAGAVLKKN
uniref:Uncharacterized protein n=1 Tax=Aegilops tauschii subsp. strangulata TaxID=200361 RepID=A0A453I368_AEGTS